MRICSSCGSRFSNDARYCPVDGQPTDEVADEPVASDPLIGTTVDRRYRVERVIGEGGMGVVYAVTHTSLNKRFALKVLRAQMSSDQDVVQRFIQEAQASSSIGHPNIVDISDFGRLPDGSFYFVMEYLDGESLTNRIVRTNGLRAEEALPILEMLTSALGAAHERGIVHRDLKPDNIFLVRRGRSVDFVKVLDFGIAKVGGAASKLTRTGTIFGTPHYMSPEQAAGQAVDRRTDVYSLGVIMYEMATGRVPFDADTFMGILSKHMFESPQRPTDLVTREGLGELEPVIMRALVKPPEERYQSMEALAADLRTIARGGHVEAVPLSRNVIEFRQATTLPSERPESLFPSARKKAPYLVAGGAALLALGALAGTALHLVQGAASHARAPVASPLVIPMPAIVTTPSATPATEAISEAPEPIRIETDPEGALVYSGESIVGTTPIELPRTDTEPTKIEIRLEGYESLELLVARATESPLRLSLRPRAQAAASTSATGERTTRTTRVSTQSRTAESSQPTPAPPTMTVTPRQPTRSPPDVLDPWQ